jgi:hypothetical protein
MLFISFFLFSGDFSRVLLLTSNLFLFPSLARGCDGSRCDVCFALGLVVLEGYDHVGDQDDVCYDGGGGAGVG